ncbi:MAG: sodium ion-translocating decarboxylase subunit beta [Acidobacteria bacterium]|nr:sodium ion-translocating decarboxylase subunit beta [Acidobacteriota bacterium]
MPVFLDWMTELWQTMGFHNLVWQQPVMWLIGGVLVYLAIRHEFEPLLLLPIGFGAILVNTAPELMSGPTASMPGGLYHYFMYGIHLEIFPPLIFLGVGALTDFGPLIAAPYTFLLGAAAQFGIFVTIIGAVLLGFSHQEAASIGIIGGADGPTTIFTTNKLAPHLLGSVMVAAYSYMSLVPVIQPPIIRLLTTRAERTTRMAQLRPVSRKERILFALVTMIICILVVPAAGALLAMLMFGNLIRESLVAERLSLSAQNEIINIVTLLLASCVGMNMHHTQFLTWDCIKILLLGAVAFSFATAGGVLLGKLMYKLTGGKVNPMIGAAGVSAVPMAARVVQRVAHEDDPECFVLMHAMGPNVAGVIGTAVAAGVLIAILQ